MRLAAIFALVLASCAPDRNAELIGAIDVEYANDRGGELTFEKDPSLGYSGTFWIPNGLADGMGEGLGYSLEGCSNGDYRCILFGMQGVFAVPRHGIVANQKYEVAGARLQVLACHDASCSLALIRTTCDNWEPLNRDFTSFRCVPESGKPAEDQSWSFLFESRRGIVLIAKSLSCPSSLVASDCTSDFEYRLKNDVGLLAPVR